MADTHIRLHGSQKLIARHELKGSDGNRIAVEIIENSPNSIIVSHITLDKNGGAVKSRSCGYCDGVLIGCVDCPNNDPFLNCVSRTITCQS